MRGINDIRQDNLRRIIRDVFGGNQSRLADRIAKEQPTFQPSFVSRLLSTNPNTRKNIGDSLARRIERIAEKPENWMDQPHHQASMELADYNLAAGPDVHRMVPVISWVQAGDWNEVIDNFHVGDAEEMIPCPVRCSSATFVLRVRGASMEPKFHDGELIFVDPEAEARNKSFVIVRLESDKEATFKQLIIEGQRRYLKPLNPNWPDPIIEITGRATICGVVIFKGEKL